MVTLHIRHTTNYRYGAPVVLGPHRIMTQPREGPGLRLIGMELRIEPHASIRCRRDFAGNTVANAVFEGLTDTLLIESIAAVELSTPRWPVFPIAASAIEYPFQYAVQEADDLAAYTQPQFADPAQRLSQWARGFIRSTPTDTLSLLKDINEHILTWVAYQSREAEGTQGPLQSLDRGWGSCRDLAVLFVEAIRTLGMAARIVSGYLHNEGSSQGSSGAGSTHAWAEVFLPGAEWVSFDPTNRTVGGHNLVPVAVGRDIAQVMPVVGSYTAQSATSAQMLVEVNVTTY